MHSITAKSLLHPGWLSSRQPTLLPHWRGHRLGNRHAWLAGSAMGLGLVAGIGSYLLQSHFQQLYEAGTALNGWENFLRQGAPWQALPPVLAAAACALVGRRRLALADPEPPLGLATQGGMPASRLRSVMRRERTVVLLATDASLGLAGIQGVRLLVYIGLAASGSALAISTLPAMVLETLVWFGCAATVTLWKRRYLEKLESWGV